VLFRSIVADRRDLPHFLLPGWWKSSSGLLLPSTVARLPQLQPQQVRLPEELRPKAQPVVIGKTGVSDLEQIAVYVDEAALHVEPSSLRKLREVAGQLNFEAAMLGTAQVAGKLHAFRGDRDAQLRMAREIFPTPFIDRIEIFFGEHKNAELFAEQQVFILQRLLIERATGTVPHELTPEEGLIIALSLIGSGSIIEEAADTASSEARGLEDWLAFFVQNGAYNSKPAPMGEIARAQEIYVRIARDPELATHDKYCPLDEWVLEDYGLTLEEQMTLGFALAAMSHAWDDDWDAGTRCYIAPNLVHDLFVKLGWEARQERALSLIAADRETFKAEFEELGDRPEQIVWEIRPLMRHPFLRCENGALVLLSPRAIQSWLTDGVHYRLLDSAQKRAAGDKKRRVSRRYTAFAGVLLEQYVLDLLRSSYGERAIGGGRVYGEQPYGRKGEAKTSDVIVDLGLDLVLFEISVSRLRADTLQIGSPEQVEEDLHRMLIAKVKQLDGCIGALIEGSARIPADAPEVDMSRIVRIWPVIVTAGNITQNDVLWQFIQTGSRELLQQAKVQPLTILDLEDLEQLAGFIEAGHDLPQILAGKTQEGYRQRELAVWVHNDPNAPNDTPRPALVERVWEKAIEKALEMIDFRKGMPPAEPS
jgi:hypothetical protein